MNTTFVVVLNIINISSKILVAVAFENEGFEQLLDFLAFREKRFLEGNLPIKTSQIVAADSARRTLAVMQEQGFDRTVYPFAWGAVSMSPCSLEPGCVRGFVSKISWGNKYR